MSTEIGEVKKQANYWHKKYGNLLRTHRNVLIHLADKEEETRILQMQNIALQMMIADDYEKYEIWRMTLNTEERKEWLAAIKDLRHNVFERWLRVTM